MDFMGMPPQQAAGFWTGLLIVLMIVLAFRVVGARRKHRVLFGDGGLEPVVLATRSFGNAAEYVPLGIGAMILMSLVGAGTIEIHLFGAPFLLGRLVHGFGLRFGKGPGAGRLIGMILTITALGYAAFLLLFAAAIA